MSVFWEEIIDYHKDKRASAEVLRSPPEGLAQKMLEKRGK